MAVEHTQREAVKDNKIAVNTHTHTKAVAVQGRGTHTARGSERY